MKLLNSGEAGLSALSLAEKLSQFKLENTNNKIELGGETHKINLE